jgi:hypothetical protein
VFTLRFGSWTSVPRSFARFVREGGLEDEWRDVLGSIEDGHVEDDRRRDAALPGLPHDPLATRVPVRLETRRSDATSLPSSSSISGERFGYNAPLPSPLAGQRCVTHLVLAMIVSTLAPPEIHGGQLPDYQIIQLPNSHHCLTPLQILDSPPIPARSLLRNRPILGSPLGLPGLAHEPVNETGVVFLFGMLAHRLGFQVESLQAGFPDCEATRQIQPGKWQRVRIEFEFESRNFLTHRHPAEACDVIVCWRHNWLECPETLEVIELRKVVRPHEIV